MQSVSSRRPPSSRIPPQAENRKIGVSEKIP